MAENKLNAEGIREHVNTSANNVVGMVHHRAEYGSPIMMGFGAGIMFAFTSVPRELRQDRIRRRRELIGLKYEHWEPPKGL